VLKALNAVSRAALFGPRKPNAVVACLKKLGLIRPPYLPTSRASLMLVRVLDYADSYKQQSAGITTLSRVAN
jgi:hypothetical protein